MRSSFDPIDRDRTKSAHAPDFVTDFAICGGMKLFGQSRLLLNAGFKEAICKLVGRAVEDWKFRGIDLDQAIVDLKTHIAPPAGAPSLRQMPLLWQELSSGSTVWTYCESAGDQRAIVQVHSLKHTAVELRGWVDCHDYVLAAEEPKAGDFDGRAKRSLSACCHRTEDFQVMGSSWWSVRMFRTNTEPDTNTRASNSTVHARA